MKPIHRLLAACLGVGGALVGAGTAAFAEPAFPVTTGQRDTARQVAQAGVPLSELAPNAPDSHTVQRG
ncbi:MAG: peptidoglycan-binding protein, partial [Rubrivivax sp.]